jgi:hypothetical protein
MCYRDIENQILTDELEKYFHMIIASCSTLLLLVQLDPSRMDRWYVLPLLIQNAGFDFLLEVSVFTMPRKTGVKYARTSQAASS